MTTLKEAAEAAKAAGAALRAYQEAVVRAGDPSVLLNIGSTQMLLSERRTDVVFELSKAREHALLLKSPVVNLNSGPTTVDDYLLHLGTKVQLGVIGAAELDEAALVVARIRAMFEGAHAVSCVITCETCGDSLRGEEEEATLALAFARGFERSGQDMCGVCAQLDAPGRAARRDQALARLPGALSSV